MQIYTLKASNTLILICYENFKVSPVNPNTEKLFDIITYPSWMYVYTGFSEKISQSSNLTLVHHSQTTGQLIWKNDLIAIF